MALLVEGDGGGLELGRLWGLPPTLESAAELDSFGSGEAGLRFRVCRRQGFCLAVFFLRHAPLVEAVRLGGGSVSGVHGIGQRAIAWADRDSGERGTQPSGSQKIMMPLIVMNRSGESGLPEASVRLNHWR